MPEYVIFPGDVTNSREVKTAGWDKGGIYLTVRPTFLVYSNTENRYWLSRSNADHLPKILAHQCGPFSLPRNLEEYEKAPKEWPHVLRVVPAGSKLRFDQAYNFGFPYGGELAGRTVRGTLFGSDEATVTLTCIAIADTQTNQWRRDENWLRK